MKKKLSPLCKIVVQVRFLSQYPADGVRVALKSTPSALFCDGDVLALSSRPTKCISPHHRQLQASPHCCNLLHDNHRTPEHISFHFDDMSSCWYHMRFVKRACNCTELFSGEQRVLALDQFLPASSYRFGYTNPTNKDRAHRDSNASIALFVNVP
jgi:hypothetical protein